MMGEPLELTDYLVILRRYWFVIVTAGLLGAILGGLSGTLLRPAANPSYTASVTGTLFTAEGHTQLQDDLVKAAGAKATTRILVPLDRTVDQTTNDSNVMQTRVPDYLGILTSDRILRPIAESAGLPVQEFRKRVLVTSPAGSNLIDIAVVDEDPAVAESYSQGLFEVLQEQAATIEQRDNPVVALGTSIDEALLPPNATDERRVQIVDSLVQQLVSSDPSVVSQDPGAALSLFTTQDYQDLLDQAPPGTTLEELQSSLSVSAGIPGTMTATTTPPDPQEAAAIRFSFTAESPESALAVADGAMKRLADNVADRYAVDEGSPLVVTSIAVTDNALLAGELVPQSRTRVNVLLGLLIGLALGVGWAFLRESQDRRIRTVHQLFSLTGSTPVGVIAVNPIADEEPVIALYEEHQAGEGYRALRATLMFSMPDARVVSVTAAESNDDAAVMAANVAVTLAQAGEKVCLVDTDFRAGRLGRLLGKEAAPGLSDVLVGTVDLDEALQPTDRLPVSVMWAGTPVSNPAALLTSRAFVDLLDALRKRFDYVLCVAASGSATSDAAVVSRRADTTLVSMRSASTTSTELDATLGLLASVQASVAGVVVSHVLMQEVERWRAVPWASSASPAER